MARGKPFSRGTSGNPSGRPKGARHKTTLAIEQLLDGEGEALTRRAIEMAMGGDTVAMRLCLERLSPPRKDRPVQFDLKPIATASDAAGAMADIIRAVADGDLTPIEAADIARILDSFTRALEATDIEKRLQALENQSNPNR